MDHKSLNDQELDHCHGHGCVLAKFRLPGSPLAALVRPERQRLRGVTGRAAQAGAVGNA